MTLYTTRTTECLLRLHIPDHVRAFFKQHHSDAFVCRDLLHLFRDGQDISHYLYVLFEHNKYNLIKHLITNTEAVLDCHILNEHNVLLDENKFCRGVGFRLSRMLCDVVKLLTDQQDDRARQTRSRLDAMLPRVLIDIVVSYTFSEYLDAQIACTAWQMHRLDISMRAECKRWTRYEASNARNGHKGVIACYDRDFYIRQSKHRYWDIRRDYYDFKDANDALLARQIKEQLHISPPGEVLEAIATGSTTS